MNIVDGESRRDICTRTEGRDSLFLMATMWDAGGRERGQVRVRNLSANGMSADCAFSVSTGEVLIFGLRGIGKIAGEVVRTGPDGRIGVQFQQRINPVLARKPVRS